MLIGNDGKYISFQFRTQAILSIQSDTLLLPVNIAKRVLEARDSINSIQVDVAECSLKIVQAISEQGIYAGKAISKCISDQARSNSNTTMRST